jgi:hypothetical protein
MTAIARASGDDGDFLACRRIERWGKVNFFQDFK